ncbi:PDZ domain-containing protein [Streptomyces ossamyceticus]|uniref:PDZ domain-containing protein n=1 Tax=Streptomyces ossamyceticus TaxID=249581 RepID=UPI003EC11CE8
MEQTALSPKARPGDGPGGDVPDPVPEQVPDHDQAPDEVRPSGPARRPHAAPRRARQRVVTLVFALVTCVVLVLSGVGLGALGLTTTGVGVLEAAGWAPAVFPRPDSDGVLPTAPVPALAAAPGPAPALGGSALGGSVLGGPAPVRATLGIEAVDATGGAGALVVGVHVPGPGYGAGLVRGDVVLAVGDTRTGSAADLARAIAAARPGTPAKLLVRHANGTRRYLMAVPGVAV